MLRLDDGHAGRSSGGNTFRFRHSEALLRNVLENAAVATFLVGPDGRLLYANRAFRDLLGYGEDDPFTVVIDDLIHPDDLPNADAQMQALENGSADGYRAERRYVKKSGEPIWVLVSASALRDEQPATLHYTIVQAINIDKQKRAEAALAESESRWNFALESAGQGVWDHNLNTKTAFYSRMWRVMRGMDPDEEVDPSAERWLARIHPDDRERIRAIIERQNTGELPTNEFEYRERHRDGHYIWILSRGKPVAWNPDGSPARVLGTDTDITKIKQVESQLAVEKERLKVTLEFDRRRRHLHRRRRARRVHEQRRRGNDRLALDRSSRPQGRRDLRHRRRGDRKADGQSGRPNACRRAGCTTSTAKRCSSGASASGATCVPRPRPVRTPHGAVIGAVLVFQDVTDSRALQRQLAHTAMHDSLTGLPNRATFQRALQDAVRQAQREAREHALCFIDLDHFKKVNDSAGHAAGDAVLRDIGVAIRGACRANDFAARIGGDEFALLLPDCSVASATAGRREDHRDDRRPALLLAACGRAYQGSAPASASPRSPAESHRPGGS